MRVWVDKGYLIQGRDVEGPGGPYFLILAYQVFDLDGAPSSGSYRGEGNITSANHLILGDPHRQTTLTEYTVARQPTSESWNHYSGFKQAIEDRREHKEDAKKPHYYAMTRQWWEGYRDGWREKRENTKRSKRKKNPKSTGSRKKISNVRSLVARALK
jgi:hypothetical protein